MTASHAPPQACYQGITRYQWLVLVIASPGWVFDIYEGQIYAATMNESMQSLAIFHASSVFGTLLAAPETRGTDLG